MKARLPILLTVAIVVSMPIAAQSMLRIPPQEVCFIGFRMKKLLSSGPGSSSAAAAVRAPHHHQPLSPWLNSSLSEPAVAAAGILEEGREPGESCRQEIEHC